MGFDPTNATIDILPMDNMNGTGAGEELWLSQNEKELEINNNDDQHLVADNPVKSDDKLLSFNNSSKKWWQAGIQGISTHNQWR